MFWADDPIIDGDRTIAVSEMTVVDSIHQIARVTYGHQIHHEDWATRWWKHISAATIAR